MSNMIYVTVTGKKQGLLSSGCSSYESIGNKYQTSHRDQILVMSMEHALTRAQNVNHGPLSFIKPIDKSSPLLAVAISNNEELDMKFDIYRTSFSGTNELYYSITLKKVYLSALSLVYPHAIDHSGDQPEEMVSVIYESITWEHHAAGTSGYSFWEERVF